MEAQNALSWLRDRVDFRLASLPSYIDQASFAQGHFLSREYAVTVRDARKLFVYRPLNPRMDLDFEGACIEILKRNFGEDEDNFLISGMPYAQDKLFRLARMSHWCTMPEDAAGMAITQPLNTLTFIYNESKYGPIDDDLRKDMIDFLSSDAVVQFAVDEESDYLAATAIAERLQRRFELSRHARTSGGGGEIRPNMSGIPSELAELFASLGSWKDVIRIMATSERMRRAILEHENVVAHNILARYNVTGVDRSWRPVNWDSFFAGFELPWSLKVEMMSYRMSKLISVKVWYGSVRELVKNPLSFTRDEFLIMGIPVHVAYQKGKDRFRPGSVESDLIWIGEMSQISIPRPGNYGESAPLAILTNNHTTNELEFHPYEPMSSNANLMRQT